MSRVRTPPPAPQGGATANVNGQRCERYVADLFRQLGFRYVRHCAGTPLPARGPVPVVVAQFPYACGGMTLKADFMVMGRTDKADVRIECKSQHTPGTTDEKLFATAQMACKTEESLVLILLDGNGARTGVLRIIEDDILQPYNRRRKTPRKVLMVRMRKFKAWARGYAQAHGLAGARAALPPIGKPPARRRRRTRRAAHGRRTQPTAQLRLRLTGGTTTTALAPGATP
jgi:hypothetical protein